MEVLNEIAHKIGFDWRLAITHFFNFAIIFVLLVKFALPKIQKTISERNKKIVEGLKMREDADKIVEQAKEEGKQISKEANMKAQDLISKGEDSAKKIISNANAESSEIIRTANIQKDEAKDLGLKDAENIITRDIGKIISAISEKAFSGKLNSENNSEFVSNVFKQNYGK